MAETAYYTSYVTRERHAIVDGAVAASIETLRMPEVALRLGEYVADLTTILENVTVPNVHHNKIRFDGKCDEKTPITAVHRREVTFCNPIEIGLHSRQRESLRDGFDTDTAEEIILGQQSYRRPTDPPVRIDSLADSGVLAYTSYCGSRLETDRGDMTVFSSPIVLIDANNPAHREPVVLLHELVHVLQLYEYPLAMPDDDQYRLYVERELEAYHVEAQIVKGYLDAGRYDDLVRRFVSESILQGAILVDDVCDMHQTNTENPFEANDRVLAALEANNINLG